MKPLPILIFLALIYFILGIKTLIGIAIIIFLFLLFGSSDISVVFRWLLIPIAFIALVIYGGWAIGHYIL